jgi:transglutaminase-like putative cysteine protease
MRFLIQHDTLYRYSAPVSYAPHVLRLTPRTERVRLLSRVLTVTPRPGEIVDFDDSYGNLLTRLIFHAPPADELRIQSRLELETFVVPGAGGEVPPSLPWPSSAPDGLDPYRFDPGSEGAVWEFARSVAADAMQSPLEFLGALNRTLYDMMDRHIRHEGAAQLPATTLAIRRGACRDITVLFLAACRSQGIPGRFVSGYQAQTQTKDGQRYLHAWPEAFVPGQGWVGWDPTHGTKVTDGYVALCAAPGQAATMPIEGGYYGDAQTSTLDWALTITTD